MFVIAIVIRGVRLKERLRMSRYWISADEVNEWFAEYDSIEECKEQINSYKADDCIDNVEYTYYIWDSKNSARYEY